MSLREQFIALDDRLARAGVPPLTQWWRDGVGAWLDDYEAGGALKLYACVGRGSSKSTTLYKLALFFTLFGDWAIPPGERHFAIVLSRLKEEAAKAIPIISRWLGMLGVEHQVAGDVIELQDQPRGIRVVAASVAASSGWRAFFVAKDERSKWPLSGVDERDAEEIDTSAGAMTATHQNAPEATFGSAWLKLGAFYEAIAAGSTPDRMVLGPTPTWVAAPHVSESSCRKKEPNPKRFNREYASLADDAADEHLLDEHLVDRAQRDKPGNVEREPGVIYTSAMDPSLGRNSWTFAIAGAREVDGRSKASVVFTKQWNAPHGKKLDPAAVLQSIATYCAAYGVSEVRTDQFHGESLAAIADRLELGFSVEVDKPTASERLRRYEGMHTRFLDDAIELPRDRIVRGDMLAIRRRVVKDGSAFTITMAVDSAGRHADFAPTISLVLERIAVDDAPAGWLRAGMRRAKAKAAAEANPNPRDADDGDRRSDLGAGFRMIKMQFDSRYCEQCKQIIIGNTCKRHGPIGDDDDEPFDLAATAEERGLCEDE